MSPSQTQPLVQTDIPLPPRILTLLTNWHLANGNGKPEFAAFLCGDMSRSKAYNRDGVEIPLSVVKVYRPCQYEIMLLRTNKPQLVSDYQPRFTKTRNTFLASWRYFDRPPTYCPAVRVVGPRYQYNPEDWDSLDPGNLELDVQQLKGLELEDREKAGRKMTVEPAASSAASCPGKENIKPKRSILPQQDANMEYEVGDEVKGAATPAPPAKRQKSDQSSKVPKCDAFLRMVYYRVDGESFSFGFPIEHCGSVAQLFERARGFFPFPSSALKCLVPGEPPLNIHEGGDVEFQTLVDRVEGLRVTQDVAVYVDVKVQVA